MQQAIIQKILDIVCLKVVGFVLVERMLVFGIQNLLNNGQYHYFSVVISLPDSSLRYLVLLICRLSGYLPLCAIGTLLPVSLATHEVKGAVGL